MPPSILSKNEKREVWKVIEEKVGYLTIPDQRRKDWRISGSGDISIYMTFSKMSQLFYDIHPQDIKKWSSFKNSFVVFVMGVHDEVLVIPLSILIQIVDGLQPKGRGEYKLHISRIGTMFVFMEKRDVELNDYFNNINLLINSDR